MDKSDLASDVKADPMSNETVSHNLLTKIYQRFEKSDLSTHHYSATLSHVPQTKPLTPLNGRDRCGELIFLKT